MTDVANIHKVAPDGSIPLRLDGVTPWTKPRSDFIGGVISFTGVAADPTGSGDVYVTGITTDVARFDTTPTADGGLPPALNRPGAYVVKFAGADGISRGTTFARGVSSVDSAPADDQDRPRRGPRRQPHRRRRLRGRRAISELRRRPPVDTKGSPGSALPSRHRAAPTRSSSAFRARPARRSPSRSSSTRRAAPTHSRSIRRAESF
jgi:hypothetical protein